MSLVTAIRSFLTPTKYYRNGKVVVSKKLMRDGSLHIDSFDTKGNILKSIVREPIDIFKYDPVRGNELTVGHVTKVKDFVEGTETVINTTERRFEKPVYNALAPKEKLVDAGGSLYYFHKFKMKDGKYLDSFNMQSHNGVKSCIQVSYDSFGKPESVKKYVV